jgi:WD40 repeat protein
LTQYCPHLERIESAMRTNEIPIKPLGPGAVQANCRIHRPGLQTQFGPLEPVVYLEYFIAERAPEDHPVAELLCRQCNWRIVVRHPSTCDLDTLWFPAAPPKLIALADHRIDPALRVTAIACSPSGRFAAVAAGIYNTPQSVSIWDLARREQVAELPPHGVIRNIAWSADEQSLVTGRGILWTGGQGSQGPSLFVWNASNGAGRLHFGSDLFGVRGLAISPDGRSLLASGMLGKTGLQGSSLDLWDLASGQLLKRLEQVELHSEAMVPVFEGVAFTPDGALAVAACSYSNPAPTRPRTNYKELPAPWTRGVRAWRVTDRREVDFATLPMPVYGISISSDGTKMFFSGKRFGIWSLSQRTLIWDKRNHDKNGMAATKNCGLVARGIGYQVDNHGPYAETAVEIYDGNTGEFLTLGRHRRPPEAIAFTPDGKSLIAGGIDGELKFWTMPSESAGFNSGHQCR